MCRTLLSRLGEPPRGASPCPSCAAAALARNLSEKQKGTSSKGPQPHTECITMHSYCMELRAGRVNIWAHLVPQPFKTLEDSLDMMLDGCFG